MNKKGFTVIELLASFTLTMIITVFLFQVVLELKDIYWSINLKTRVLDKNAIVATTLNNYFKNNCTDGNTCYSSNVASLNNKKISIGTKDIEMPDKTEIKDFSTTGGSLSLTNSNGSDNAYVTIKYKIESAYLEKPIEFNYVHSFVGTVINIICPSGTVDGGDGYCYTNSTSKICSGYTYNGACYANRNNATWNAGSSTCEYIDWGCCNMSCWSNTVSSCSGGEGYWETSSTCYEGCYLTNCSSSQGYYSCSSGTLGNTNYCYSGSGNYTCPSGYSYEISGTCYKTRI